MHLRDIQGQEEAISQIRHAVSADRLPHGLILAGSEGVGKGATAGALAAWFLCDQPGPDDACGKCPSCHLIAAGTHPDYHIIYRQLIRLDKKDSKARDLSIDLIRKYLLDPAARKPLQNRGKVFVIEEAETMTRDAANSMLKTLEEPHGRTLILILTDQPHWLLPTIRSRCQMIRFRQLSRDLVVQKLADRGVEPDTAKLAAGIAEGSLGLALRWSEDGVVARSRELFAQIAASITGRIVDLPAWFVMAAAEYAEKQEQRDANVSKDQATREGVILYLRLAADYLRLRLRDLADTDLSLKLCRMIDDIAQAQVYVAGNVNVGLVLEHVGNRMS